MLRQSLATAKIAILSVLTLSAAVPAMAQTAQFNFSNDLSDSQVATLSTNGGSSYITGYVGRYKGSLNNGPTINIFCVDVNHEIHGGDSYTADISQAITNSPGPLNGQYYSGGLGSEMTTSDATPQVVLTSAQQTTRADEVAWLTDNYLNSTAATFLSNSDDTSLADNLTALNFSIWDIIEDGGNGLSAGSLIGDSNATSKYGTLTNYYENLASSHSSYTSTTADWIQAPHDPSGNHMQSYAYVNAVPEVSSFGALGIGFGALVLIVGLRYRKRDEALKAC